MLLKTGQCFTEELELNCPTIVACVAALPTGPAAAAGDLMLGKDGKYHALPAQAPDVDAQQLSIMGTTISLTNGGSVTLPAQVAGPVFATPAQTVAGTPTTLMVNPADLYARENIAAQTGLSNNVAAIPAPAANESVWGQNLLGETLHYAPGLGWQLIKGYTGSLTVVPGTTGPGAAYVAASGTAPRAGKVNIITTIDSELVPPAVAPAPAVQWLLRVAGAFVQTVYSSGPTGHNTMLSMLNVTVQAGDLIEVIAYMNPTVMPGESLTVRSSAFRNQNFQYVE